MSVPLARRNLMHEKGRLALSVAGIAAALALILLLPGFRSGLYATLTAFVDNLGADLIVAQSGVQGMFASDSTVPRDLHDEAVAAAGAQEAGHIVVADIIFTAAETKTPVLLVGYEPDTAFGAPWNIGAGREVADDDEILLDTWLAQRANIEVGDQIVVLGTNFYLVGLTRETTSWMSPYIFVSLDAATSALGLNNVVSYHLLQLPASGDLDRAVATIAEELPGVDALTPEEVAAADRRVLATVMNTLLNVMIFIGAVIGTAVMGLTAYTAVVDGRREYGVLKAVGAPRRHLNWLVLRETAYRAVLGFLFGVGLAYLLAALIMAIWPQFTIVIEAEAVAQAAALALLMIAIAAWLPICRLHGIDPVLVFKE